MPYSGAEGPLLWPAPSLKLGESPRHFTFWPTSTTKRTAVAFCNRSIEGKGATVSPGLCSSASAASYGSATKRGRKISSARWASSSMRSCSGTRATWMRY